MPGDAGAEGEADQDRGGDRGPRVGAQPTPGAEGEPARPARPASVRNQEFARPGPVLKRKSTSPLRLPATFWKENADVCPGFSCMKTGSEATTLLCQAYGMRRSGAVMTGQGRIARPARNHPARTTNATGTMKMTDS